MTQLGFMTSDMWPESGNVTNENQPESFCGDDDQRVINTLLLVFATIGETGSL